MLKYNWLDNPEVEYCTETDKEGYLLVDNGAIAYATLNIINDKNPDLEVWANISVVVDFDDVDVDWDSGYEKSDWWQTAIDTSGWVIDFNSIKYDVNYETYDNTDNSKNQDSITVDEAANLLGTNKEFLEAEVDRRCKELYKLSEDKLMDEFLKYMEEQKADAEISAYEDRHDSWYEAVNKVNTNLDNLNEAVDSAAAQQFYDNALKTIIDVESFEKAFKSEIPTDVWDSLFVSRGPKKGLLKHRGVYGIIKTEPRIPAEACKALKKFWVLQFNDDAQTLAQVNADQEAEQRKQTLIDEKKKKAEEVISLIDKNLYSQVCVEWRERETDEEAATRGWGYKRFDGFKIMQSAYDETKVYISFWDQHTTTFDVVDDKTAKEIADSINEWFQEVLEDLTAPTGYEGNKWYSKELKNKASGGFFTGTYIFQLPDDEGIEVVENLYISKLQKLKLPSDAILSIYRSTSYDGSDKKICYYSVSPDADEMSLEEFGISLDPDVIIKERPTDKPTISYEEISESEARKSISSFFITGMHRWFKRIMPRN